MLSQAGREVLIKAMVQAIFTYTMSYFKLPMGLVIILQALLESFGEDKRAIEEKFIEFNGKLYVSQNLLEVWASKT